MSLDMIELYENASSLFGDFVIDDDVDINDRSYSNLFLRSDVLYADLLKELMKREDEPLMQELPKTLNDFKSYFESVKDYEDKHRKKYKDEKRKQYQTRYGMKFSMLLPKSIKLQKDKKTLIKDFIKSINYDKVPLKYVVFEEVRGKGKYLVLYISDRAYLDVEVPVLYPRDYKTNDGIKKKGTPRLDSEGNQLTKRIYFAKCKVSYFKFPEGAFEAYIAQLKSYLIEAIKGLLSGFRTRKRQKDWEGKTYADHQGLLITKAPIYKRFHHKYRQSLNEVNASKRYIENMLNGNIYKITKEIERTFEGEVIKSEHNSKAYEKIKDLKSLFFKYEARYTKKSFHNADNEEISLVICQKNGNLPGIKQATRELIQMFNNELLKIIPDALAFDIKRGTVNENIL